MKRSGFISRHESRVSHREDKDMEEGEEQAANRTHREWGEAGGFDLTPSQLSQQEHTDVGAAGESKK